MDSRFRGNDIKIMFYVIYSIILVILAIYSYSLIDLNLTLSSNSLYQNIQQQLILLGYFSRPLSTTIFIGLLIFLFTFYLIIIRLTAKNKFTKKNLVFLVGLSAIILFFSYSAFSHDLFNYMFDARIVTTYQQNPYLHSALDFPNDLWTRFMHWTHRTYPYGPIWLLITLPFSALGFGKFVLTLFNFKLLFTLFHLGNVFLIYKILKKINTKFSLLGTAFYAFNPVVLIESLVSPHNEVLMLFFLLWAIYFAVVENNKLAAIFNLLLSAGIKFVTIILLPLFIFYSSSDRQARTINTNRFFILVLLFLLLPLMVQIIYREPYPWYFIPFIGLGAILVNYKNIIILVTGFSSAALFRYIPFLYLGDYSQLARQTQNSIFLLVSFLTILTLLLSLSKTKTRR